jgi:hypothetical protein
MAVIELFKGAERVIVDKDSEAETAWRGRGFSDEKVKEPASGGIAELKESVLVGEVPSETVIQSVPTEEQAIAEEPRQKRKYTRRNQVDGNEE